MALYLIVEALQELEDLKLIKTKGISQKLRRTSDWLRSTHKQVKELSKTVNALSTAVDGHSSSIDEQGGLIESLSEKPRLISEVLAEQQHSLQRKKLGDVEAVIGTLSTQLAQLSETEKDLEGKVESIDQSSGLKSVQDLLDEQRHSLQRKKLSEAEESLGALSTQVLELGESLDERVTLCAQEVSDLSLVSAQKAELNVLRQKIGLTYLHSLRIGDAQSGKLTLVLDSESETVAADDLNAAAASTYKKEFLVQLKNSTGDVHIWAAFSPVLTPDEKVDDADVGAPTVPSVSFIGGIALVIGTFDTDAGSTKTYAAPAALTGTLTFTTDSDDVTGSGTLFDSELVAGDWIQLDADALPVMVASVTDDTNLVLDLDYVGDGGAGAGSKTEVLSVDVQVASDDKLLGWTVTKVTKLYHVV